MSMKNDILTCLLFSPFLFACQSNQLVFPSQKISNQNISEQKIYLDNQFHVENPYQIETENELFRLDDEMSAMVNTKLVNSLTTKQKARVLLEHIFNEENIALSYEGNANFTATKTYHGKKANCMSLTIMAYALAKAANMNVNFQQVKVPEYWVRNGQYNLLTGHVNLLVRENTADKKHLVWGSKSTLIDFDPFVAKKNFPSQVIEKNTILAMFYNNKGAEAMVYNNYPLAYQYLKEATLVDPQFSAAWGNLGILYKLTGHYESAEYAYLKAITLNHNNLTSWGNLALLLNMEGRVEEALPIEEHIHKSRLANPYYHALLGNEALMNNAYQAALSHYKKAIQLDDEQHEFYFGLAKTYYKQDNYRLAKRAMTKAISLTNMKNTQRQYIAKLNFLKVNEPTNP